MFSVGTLTGPPTSLNFLSIGDRTVCCHVVGTTKSSGYGDKTNSAALVVEVAV